MGRVLPDESVIHQHTEACQAILVSHAHFDHFMDVPTIAAKCSAEVYGSKNTCMLAQQQGVLPDRVHVVTNRDTFQEGSLQIEVIPAAHPWIPGYTYGKINSNLKTPLRLVDFRMDACFSFLIRYAGQRVLVWSSNRTDHALPADILICRAVSDRRWYQRMMAKVHPKVVIPSHWDDIFRPYAVPPLPFFSPPRLAFPPVQRINLKEFAQSIASIDPDCRVLLPQCLEWYDLP